MQLKSFNLTPAGKINIQAYPPSAVEYADDEVAHMLAQRDVKTPWRLFCKIANDWCKERGIVPEWRKMFLALEAQGYTKDTPCVEVVRINSKSGPVFEGVTPVEQDPKWVTVDLWDRNRFISNIVDVVAMVGKDKANEIAEMFAHVDPISGLNTINYVYFDGDQYGLTGNEANMPHTLAQPPYRLPLSAGAMRTARQIRLAGMEQWKQRFAQY